MGPFKLKENLGDCRLNYIINTEMGGGFDAQFARATRVFGIHGVISYGNANIKDERPSTAACRFFKFFKGGLAISEFEKTSYRQV